MKTLKVILLMLALTVVGFGAYTRLKDAGLGCPDWPGCYGHMLYPQTDEEIIQADKNHPERPFDEAKAWPEMYHRYLAGILGIGIAYLAIRNLIYRQHQTSSYIMLGVLGLQGLLGAWTVTWLLHPVVVLAHLIGGFTLSALLFHQLISSKTFHQSALNINVFILIGLQIILGGWTSTNYAALVCPDFPYCQGLLFPPLYLQQAFFSLLPIGNLYEFGIFSHEVRVTIQMMHRYVAFILTIGLCSAIVHQWRQTPWHVSLVPLSLLFIQIGLGIANILLLLPISIAVAHNLVALCLLLSWLWYTQKQQQLNLSSKT